MKITSKENYTALRKCVIADYPYPLEWDDSLVLPIFEDVYDDLVEQHKHINNRYYSRDGEGLLLLNYIDHYVILCHRFANKLWKTGMSAYAEAVYYSLRNRGNIDLYYTTEIGPYFIPAHSLGTCMDSHATYGKLFRIYNGCHLGPYSIVGKEPSEWKHPVIGDYVTMLSGSRVYGNSKIGNNVIISVNTVVINEEIPDNCIVSGISPNLVFQRLKVPNCDTLINL